MRLYNVRMRTLRQGGAGDPGGLRQDGAEEQRANRRQGKGLVSGVRREPAGVVPRRRGEAGRKGIAMGIICESCGRDIDALGQDNGAMGAGERDARRALKLAAHAHASRNAQLERIAAQHLNLSGRAHGTKHAHALDNTLGPRASPSLWRQTVRAGRAP